MITEERTAARPERAGVLQAIRRYPLTAALPLVLLTALGTGLGYARQPTYEARAELAVGTLNITDPSAVGSVVEATQSLAAVYARLADATPVQARIARRVGEKAGSWSVSATPLPGSPIVWVIATADSEGGAVRVANIGADSLRRYAQHYDDTTGHTRSVYRRFRDAAARFSRTNTRVRELAVVYGRRPTRANKRRLDRATTDLEAARLLRDALRINYQVSQQNARSSPVLRSFSRADGATSDRFESIQVFALLGLLAGLALGAALATARLNRRIARLTRP
jgi:hypothetical protein